MTGGGDDGTMTGDDTTEMPDGAALFADNCSMCHGADGKGTKDGPQILDPVTGYATYVVRHGRNEMGFPAPMKAFATTDLADNELAAILGFLSMAEKPTTGPELYGRFCQNCHGETGRAGRVGKNIVREVSNMASIVRAGHGGTSYGSRTSYMPKWSTTEITDAELALIKSYVTTL
jgi:mono/diheme cytochrome c family protein